MRVMKLSKKEFQQRVRDNTLRIAFVGMSNIGKSRLAKDLERKGGWTRLDIDTYICERLEKRDLRDIAMWLGFPASPTYAEREVTYLACEERETFDAVVRARSLSGSVVLDTTGSVVYLSAETLREIKKDFFVIHVGTSAKDVDELFETYKNNPKPVVWHGMYGEAPQGNDFFDITTAEAQMRKDLEHSYRSLLADRLMRYTLLADCTINRFVLYKPKTVPALLLAIEKSI